MKKILLASAMAGVLLSSSANAGSLTCGAPRVFLGDEPGDRNPVVSVEVDYNGELHQWQVFHHHYNGMVTARAQQYAMEDWSNQQRTRWAGSLNRNRSLYMVGEAGVNMQTGEGYYEEWLYNRNQGNRLDMHMRSQCRLDVGRFTLDAAPTGGS